MMGKKWLHLLFPPLWLLLLLTPIAAASLVYSLLCLPETDWRRIGAYVLSFYTLTVWCVRVPRLVRGYQRLRQDNRLLRRWREDLHLRTRITLFGNVLWNTGYATLQLGLGIVHHSAWFFTLAVYYGSLALMRFWLVRYTLSHSPGEDLRREWHLYRICGWVFLLLNLALSGMLMLLLTENRMVEHHPITTIAQAAYTFTTLTMAIVQRIRTRRWGSPVLSAAKAVSLTAASVSMLNLEATMLATFGGAEMTVHTMRLFLSLSGGAVCIGVVVMAVLMLVKSKHQLHKYR